MHFIRILFDCKFARDLLACRIVFIRLPSLINSSRVKLLILKYKNTSTLSCHMFTVTDPTSIISEPLIKEEHVYVYTLRYLGLASRFSKNFPSSAI